MICRSEIVCDFSSPRDRRACAMPDLPPGRAFGDVTRGSTGQSFFGVQGLEEALHAHPRSGMAQARLGGEFAHA